MKIIRKSKPCALALGHLQFIYFYEDGSRKFVLVHREKMEKHLGRPLTTKEIVHHKDGNPANNKLSNLEIMSRAEHARHHAKEKPAEMATYICPTCKICFALEARVVRHNQGTQRKAGPFCGRSCAGKYGQKLGGRKRRNWPHGTYMKYYYGCHCVKCRKANTARARRYLTKKRKQQQA